MERTTVVTILMRKIAKIPMYIVIYLTIKLEYLIGNKSKSFQVVQNLIKCATDEYQCKNNFCIPIEKFCDTKRDCSDGEDEYDGCVNDVRYYLQYFSLFIKQ